MPNKKVTIENDDIQKVSAEHEDEQAILEYDPTWYDPTDSNKNESDSSDDNDKYTKLTSNHELYKSVMFMSKDEPKMTLGR